MPEQFHMTPEQWQEYCRKMDKQSKREALSFLTRWDLDKIEAKLNDAAR